MTIKIFWALVEVRSGIPVSIETFQNEQHAEEKELKLRKSLNLEKDETGVFQINIDIGD